MARLLGSKYVTLGCRCVRSYLHFSSACANQAYAFEVLFMCEKFLKQQHEKF